jgi:hypothetical protein
MFFVIRPDFEVVKGGRIFNKIKHLHLSFLAGIKPSLLSGSFAKRMYQKCINHPVMTLRAIASPAFWLLPKIAHRAI